MHSYCQNSFRSKCQSVFSLEGKKIESDYIKKTMFLVGALSSLYLSATFRFVFVDEMFLDIINLKEKPKTKNSILWFSNSPQETDSGCYTCKMQNPTFGTVLLTE